MLSIEEDKYNIHNKKLNECVCVRIMFVYYFIFPSRWMFVCV